MAARTVRSFSVWVCGDTDTGGSAQPSMHSWQQMCVLCLWLAACDYAFSSPDTPAAASLLLTGHSILLQVLLHS
jgi:hypothetical protein